MRSLIAGVLSFMVGIMSYILTLKLVWNQSLGGDTYAVLYWGGFAFFVIVFPIYLLTIKFIDYLSFKHKYIFYPLSCMLIFFVPTSFITISLGGTFNIFSPEAMLFHSFFLSAGLVFGLTIWILRRKKGLVI